jgi:hypothetical protein
MHQSGKSRAPLSIRRLLRSGLTSAVTVAVRTSVARIWLAVGGEAVWLVG